MSPPRVGVIISLNSDAEHAGPLAALQIAKNKIGIATLFVCMLHGRLNLADSLILIPQRREDATVNDSLFEACTQQFLRKKTYRPLLDSEVARPE